MMDDKMHIKFYGTRGSLPAPLTAKEVEEKIIKAVEFFYLNKNLIESEEDIPDLVRNLAFPMRGTYGGNTTCCVVRCGEITIVLDMGSGIQRFGKEIMPEISAKKGKTIHFCMSHVHWDHVQGFPFFDPIFTSRKKDLPNNNFTFYGSVEWQGKLEKVLCGQMNSPMFPIQWGRITTEGPNMQFVTIYNGYETIVSSESAENGVVLLRASRMNHPNETYGWRIEYRGKVFVFATDTEPFACGPDPTILNLAKDADLLYLDCQFSRDQYIGKDGPPRMGWGHGYDEWCVEVAKAANVRNLLIGHHDPAATDQQIFEKERKIRQLFGSAHAAYDGLEVSLKINK